MKRLLVCFKFSMITNQNDSICHGPPMASHSLNLSNDFFSIFIYICTFLFCMGVRIGKKKIQKKFSYPKPK